MKNTLQRDVTGLWKLLNTFLLLHEVHPRTTFQAPFQPLAIKTEKGTEVSRLLTIVKFKQIKTSLLSSQVHCLTTQK